MVLESTGFGARCGVIDSFGFGVDNADAVPDAPVGRTGRTRLEGAHRAHDDHHAVVLRFGHHAQGLHLRRP